MTARDLMNETGSTIVIGYDTDTNRYVGFTGADSGDGFPLEGRLVRTLALGRREAGIYMEKERAAYWDGKSDTGEQVASGIYFYSINAGDFAATRKMTISK